MENRYKLVGYNITTEPKYNNQKYGVTPELEKQMETLYLESTDKNNKKIIDKLTQLIIKYPLIPILKNYLSIAYNVRGNHEKADEVNKWILSEHPDYLFAILNAANKCIEDSELERVPEILGETLELKDLYPGRDLFHVAEVTGFFKVVIRYYAKIGDYDLAENRLEVLKGFAPDHPDTKHAEMILFHEKMKLGYKLLEQENKERIVPKIIKSVPTISIESAPLFNHPQIENLYQFGLRIPQEKLKEIIALPRQTLIEDLERVLLDAEYRYEYFIEKEYDEETHSFILHALFLLMEIEAEECLPKVLCFLENDYELIDFYLGDHKTTTLWQCIYKLGFNQIEVLKQFLIRPGIDTYSKTATSEMLCQVFLHAPERKEEILKVYYDVFKTFSNANIDDNLIDSDFLGLSISDTIDCNFHELLPVIKELYDKQYVHLGISGSYEDVEKEFSLAINNEVKRELINIFELYDEIITTWSGYTSEEVYEEDYEDDYDFPEKQLPAVSNKIGRNEPCPCGSGKKYKKCCLK